MVPRELFYFKKINSFFLFLTSKIKNILNVDCLVTDMGEFSAIFAGNQLQVLLAKQHLACLVMKEIRLSLLLVCYNQLLVFFPSNILTWYGLCNPSLQRQMSARVLMPPPRSLPPRRSRPIENVEISTSSNASNSGSGPSSRNTRFVNEARGHHSNLSSNSDAHKPRRKRRPKKKKQVGI